MNIKVKRPKFTKYQEDILYNKSRFTITEASTKVGKTFSHIFWLYEMAHKPDVRKGYNFWWVAPVYSQAKIAFKRMRSKVAKSNLYKINESSMVITCPNGAEIHFKTAKDPDSLYGEDVYACVFDEAPRAKREAFVALRSTLTATSAPLKMIGNFKGKSNWMHKLKDKALTDPQYAYYKINCWDAVEAGILSKEEVEQAQRDLTTLEFKELYLAEAAEDHEQLINNESIDKLKSNLIVDGIKYITADIARLGQDKTVILVWSGLKVVDYKTLDISTIPQSADAIRTLQSKWNVNTNNIIVDEDGVGGGVKDLLGCQGFVNNSVALKVNGQKENFASLKDQCYYKLAETINRNEIGVTLPEEILDALCEELEMVRLPSGVDHTKIRLMSKEAIKKHIGRSPDYSDALMMRIYFMLNKSKGTYHIS